jgi:hypothetical protein
MESKSVEVYVKKPDYLTPEDLAFKLAMSLKWVQTNTQLRRIPGQTKIGRLWRYRRDEVERRLLSGAFLLEKPHKKQGRSVKFKASAQGRPLTKEIRNGH